MGLQNSEPFSPLRQIARQAPPRDPCCYEDSHSLFEPGRHYGPTPPIAQTAREADINPDLPIELDVAPLNMAEENPELKHQLDVLEQELHVRISCAPYCSHFVVFKPGGQGRADECCALGRRYHGKRVSLEPYPFLNWNIVCTECGSGAVRTA